MAKAESQSSMGEVEFNTADADKPCLKRPADLPNSLSESSTSNGVPSSDAAGSFESPLVVPLVLLFASYCVYLYPERGTAVILLLGALASFGPTAGPMYSLFIDVFERVAHRASGSKKLRTLARQQMHATLNDPVTQRSFTTACRDSLIEALNDETTQAMMVSCCSKAVTTATIAASQDEDLQCTLNTAMRNGVKEALSDDTVVGTFFNVVKEGLRDPKMHQAALKGAVTAANPLKDVSVPSLPSVENPLKAVSKTLKEAIVDAEAKTLAEASGLSRAPPPMVQGAKPESKSPSEGSCPRKSPELSPAADPLEAFLRHGRDL
jgi:hypothetical protein